MKWLDRIIAKRLDAAIEARLSEGESDFADALVTLERSVKQDIELMRQRYEAHKNETNATLLRMDKWSVKVRRQIDRIKPKKKK